MDKYFGKALLSLPGKVTFLRGKFVLNLQPFFVLFYALRWFIAGLPPATSGDS